jgi:tetratricopeptide (TPR) repeat protein
MRLAAVTPVMLGASSASAEPATDPGTSRAALIDEARQRYQRGLQLFIEANYEAARVEFERDYQLAPSDKILYNIGLSYEQLGDYVQAQTTLKSYLEQGDTEIGEESRNEVLRESSTQSSTVKTQSFLCDVFTGVSILSAGVATYFTIKAFRGESSERAKVEVGLGPMSTILGGSF